jgi:VanZ family protein
MSNSELRYYLPPIIWAVIMMIVSSVPHLGIPPIGITFDDKLAHFGEYLVLGFLAGNAVWRLGRSPKSNFLMTSSLSGLYGILDEIHQHFIPGRTADPLDATADILGSAAGVGIYLWWRSRHPRQSSEARDLDSPK